MSAARSAVAAGLCVALISGCTTTNTATLRALETRHPVSASEQYIDREGHIITPKEYEDVGEVAIETEHEAPRHGAADTEVKIADKLDRAVDGAQGDAIVNFEIGAAEEYDPGDHYTSAVWQSLGWSFFGTGAIFAITGLALGPAEEDDAFDVQQYFLITGGVFAGIGLLSLIVGYSQNEPARWKLQGTGRIVRRTRGPTRTEPSPASRPAETSPAPTPPDSP